MDSIIEIAKSNLTKYGKAILKKNTHLAGVAQLNGQKKCFLIYNPA